MSRYPTDWPGEGDLDLAVHDLPHRSSTTEWWYVNAHLRTVDGREASLFAAFFRVVTGRDEKTGEDVHAHSLTWALSLPGPDRYCAESLVDRDAPRMGKEKIARGEGTSDSRLRRALGEVLDRGRVPWPDRLFETDPHVSLRRLDLDFDGRRFRKEDDGSYRLVLDHPHFHCGCDLRLVPSKRPVRHGEDGVVKGTRGEDMFYYFVPRLAVTGTLTLDGAAAEVASGEGWYDHEFGRHLAHEGEAPPPASSEAAAGTGPAPRDVAWNWLAAQLDDGTEVTAYTLVDMAKGEVLGERALVVDREGARHEHHGVSLEPENRWLSTRTFNGWPTRWRLRVPSADLDLEIAGAFDDQEFVTLISKPAFWEGRVSASGTREGRPVSGLGYVERSGFLEIDTLDDFFGAVGQATRRSVRELIPLEPSFEIVRDLVASDTRAGWMDGVSLDQFARTMIRPVREITDRGGKAWRSYAALACCDVVGGDSRDYVHWLAMPEFMHVGSLIVDDVQDGSTVRRGGPACHVVYGEPIAINAGTACYFIGQKLLRGRTLSSSDKLRLYDLYFEALRAGHSGQAFDLDGLADLVPKAIETGDGGEIERRVLAIHRLKTAAPAASLARMGAIAGGGTDLQIEAVGDLFEAIGLAFQIVDDVLNLRGFKGDLKQAGEDVSHGKLTHPVAKAFSLLSDRRDREALWSTLESRPKDPAVVGAFIRKLEACGALDASSNEASALVEAAWRRFDPLVEDSIPKLMLRAFGWYVLERHY